MRGVNKVILVGTLGKDPQVNGSVVKFSLATSEKWKDEEKTEWHNIVAFGKIGEICGQYLKKGSLVYIEGKLSTNKWQDKEGNTRYTTEIIANQMQMLGGNKNAQNVKNEHSQPGFDDDIPF